MRPRSPFAARGRRGYAATLLLFTLAGVLLLMFLGSGCGSPAGNPVAYSNIVPRDGSLAVKMTNTTSLQGGLRAPQALRQTTSGTTTTTVTTPASGTLIKVLPDDIFVSVSDMSIFSTDGKEFVLFTEPKEINLLNLLKDGEIVALSSDVPVGDYNRLKFNINYVRVLLDGEKQRIAMDQTVYLSTADSNLTTFTVSSGMKSTVKMNFDVVDKIFRDRNGNFRLFPAVYLVYEGMEVVRKY